MIDRSPRPSPLLLALSLLLAGGCSSQAGQLVVKSDTKKVAYAQKFSQAVAERTEEGMYQFVLVADDKPRDGAASGTRKKQSPGKRLDPADTMPLHQVVYVKVLWRPMDGTDRSIGSNAALRWYVLSDTANGAVDLLEYTGSAFVMVNPKDDETKVSIRAGSIKPGAIRGGLTDPIGPARIEGSFTAVNDPARLHELLAATRARTAAAVARGNAMAQ